MPSFKRNLVLGYSVSLLLLLGSSLASFISIRNLLHNNALVEHTNTVIDRLEHALSQLKDAETGQRGFLLTGEEQFLEPYNGSLELIYNDIKELRDLTTDNQLQQLSLIKLTDIVQARMLKLQRLIEQKRTGKEIPIEELRAGKSSMDATRQLVSQMEARERQLLSDRSQDAKRFAERTPVLIITASLLAIIITVLSFLQVSRDLRRRQALQQQLLQKDKEITERINIITAIAEKVSLGDYHARVDEVHEDRLGLLAVSLNKMTASLDSSFSLLSKKEWLQSGISQLNEKMLGEQTIESAAENVLNELTAYTNSSVAAFYHCYEDKLEFVKGYAFAPPKNRMIIKSGEGLVGQAMASKKLIALKDILHSDIMINYAAGEIKPKEVIALPLMFEGTLKAVLILGSITHYGDNHKEYLQTVADNIAIVINTAETRRRLNELLMETQAQAEELASQAEELSTQHSDLEIANAELQAQSEKLKVSEEELRVQQEELLQSNSELEERTHLLEERNQVIAEQNRDIEYKAEQLELSSRYKSEFLANMSHELRTPLNSILLLSRLMSDNPGKNLTAEQVEYARVIQSSGQGLLSLIDEILDLSKIESGKMEMQYSNAPVEEIVQDMRSLFDPVAAEKHLPFEIKIDPQVPAKIETDLQRLEQVLKNLLSNAFKFTSTGAVGMHIYKLDDASIAIAVTDTGIGIAEDKQQLIFEAFQQEDGSTRRNFGGTGLGLSISRELARLLGGEIKLESTRGKGSRFILSVPLTRPAETPEEPARRPLISNQVFTDSYREDLPAAAIPVNNAVKDDRNNISMADRVVLVIEDDIIFSRTLLDFARNAGYKGIVANRGDEGLQLARQFLPMAILLDIHLPGMNGWEVMEALKAGSRTRHIPVHVMSSVEARNRSISAGALDFSNKPLAIEDMKELFTKIEQAIARSTEKVLILEENSVHAKALAYFLSSNQLETTVTSDMPTTIATLEKEGRGCVIFDSSTVSLQLYEVLEQVRTTEGLGHIPVIVFTGKSLSQGEEIRIKKYADSIVVKTAHSYKRLLDEVSLFLHVMETKAAPHVLSEKGRMMHDVLKNKKILLVDDDVRNIYSLTKAMEHNSINVITAIDGREAIKQLEENKDVQLVLMDMMMPEMDGYESIRYIRAKGDGYAKLPIIAVTAKAMAGDREKCIEAGASDYISKPVDTDQLISLLRVWLYNDQ